ncbi:LysR family transcriptional regulator [Pseudomonas fulva]|jgi:DNA-binding transcriptional LysR family regulator|uniref:LysR family transcriptional regulator n=2 Tax=Pseudomonas TaxID=286 RepID=A0A2V4IWG3_9PSED|nr:MULTISPECIES: LysR family transcriptional regulator [Pseudomonas]MBA1206096.1 LysR family transcriptional regulator [Pseudomonas fulva]MBA1215372.1 LysR family transcriptional regulator [Pseudomonas fulva]MBA1220236.1 LysR family transcriptional regulator [Pseudomonas fulva]MBN4164982.1 LysR family transcriptional regulator [Pseudomonas fulva]MBN6789959.1 LysR family transcriptional regulator [Pseudomonas fulva]
MSFNSETIQVFLTVLDRGSFSAAARSLQRVPSAISMAIGNLEAELGYDLFQRGPREVRPTAQALALEPHARLIAEQLGLLQVHAVELSQGLESNLTLAVVPDVDQRPLIAAIAEVGERYPLLEIAILSAPQEQALGLLDSGRADLCVAFAGLQVDPQRGFQLMGVESLVATLAPHHPAARPGAIQNLEDLTAVRQILVRSRDLPLSDPRMVIGATHWTTDSFDIALQMVEAGLGWGDLPLSRVAPLLDAGRLQRLTFHNTRNELQLPVHVFWRKQQPLLKAARMLVERLALR